LKHISRWEGWHPIYYGDEKCSKPPTSIGLSVFGCFWPSNLDKSQSLRHEFCEFFYVLLYVAKIFKNVKYIIIQMDDISMIGQFIMVISFDGHSNVSPMKESNRVPFFPLSLPLDQQSVDGHTFFGPKNRQL
jgi:hypothetical protein